MSSSMTKREEGIGLESQAEKLPSKLPMTLSVAGRAIVGLPRSAESARAAGEAFGVSQVFSDHELLVNQPDIDVVAVTVKVPHHRELVSAALAAGKAVYCEWPLGRDLDDARAARVRASIFGRASTPSDGGACTLSILSGAYWDSASSRCRRDAAIAPVQNNATP